MLVACMIVSLLYVSGQCQNLLTPPNIDDDQELIQCVLGILNKYYSEEVSLTYVNINLDDDRLLKAIYLTTNFVLITRKPTKQLFASNNAYLILVADVADFIEYFDYLIMEPGWNPYARFLVVIKSIEVFELRQIFDEFLRLHVNNVVVVNGTEDAHLYAYNPFDNYACGKSYKDIINYGPCSEVTEDLYPNKLVTGLKNCNLKASVAHRPPLSIDPLKREDNYTLLGTEEFIITLLGQKEQFTVEFEYSYNGELFSTVAPNMTAIGPMEMLQKNEVDIIFGAMMMVATRAEAFTYLCGYHDYSDELRFAVKRASLIPTWKYIYLEFEFDVWALLLVTLILYSFIVTKLLPSTDAGEVILRLLDNLLLHGRSTHTRLTVKCVLITWAWFAYLINTFYQSILFSLTTQPSMEYQVSDEEMMIKYDFEPCFSPALRKYLFSETSKLSKTGFFKNGGCNSTIEALDTISKAKDMFTLIPNYVYLYNQHRYNDKWGNGLIYYFDKPYTKFLFGYYFYKGFPITQSLQLNALRMRESGLADKSLQDQYYLRKLKQKFADQTFQTRFVFPWCVCIPGFVIASVTFIIELLLKHKNHRFRFSMITRTRRRAS